MAYFHLWTQKRGPSIKKWSKKVKNAENALDILPQSSSSTNSRSLIINTSFSRGWTLGCCSHESERVFFFISLVCPSFTVSFYHSKKCLVLINVYKIFVVKIMENIVYHSLNMWMGNNHIEGFYPYLTRKMLILMIESLTTFTEYNFENTT